MQYISNNIYSLVTINDKDSLAADVMQSSPSPCLSIFFPLLHYPVQVWQTTGNNNNWILSTENIINQIIMLESMHAPNFYPDRQQRTIDEK